MPRVELVGYLLEEGSDLHRHELVVDLSLGVKDFESEKLEVCSTGKDLRKELLDELLPKDRDLQEAQEGIRLICVHLGLLASGNRPPKLWLSFFRTLLLFLSE